MDNIFCLAYLALCISSLIHPEFFFSLVSWAGAGLCSSRTTCSNRAVKEQQTMPMERAFWTQVVDRGIKGVVPV